MKWTLISFFCFVTLYSAVGQKQLLDNNVKGVSPVNIALDEVNKRFTPPQASFSLKSGVTKKSEILVTYVNFPEEAKLAFEFAVSIWENNIESTVPIMIQANWGELEGGILAHGGPASFHKNFESALVHDVYYPIALAEKLMGRNFNGDKEADIVVNIDNSWPWYFKTDGNTPVSQYDFVTATLHEIGHGLGISGFLKDENGIGGYSNASNNPSAYDYYLYNASEQRITDASIFESPSTKLHDQLTSNDINFYSSHDIKSSKSEIYAPSSWINGVSIYHLKSSASSTADELMSPSLCKGEAIHNPGKNTILILNEIGWNANSLKLQQIKDFENAVAELPVQTKIENDIEFDHSSVEVIFSTDGFTTKDSVSLAFNSAKNQFEGNIPVNFYLGKVKYYFKAKTADNKVFTQPYQAPDNLLNFKIGPDYYPPSLNHNPLKLVSSSNPTIELEAIATDNMGIESVNVEYMINGVEQDAIQLNAEALVNFNGELHLPSNLSAYDVIEYRLIAEDNSSRKNKKYLPSKGFYKVKIIETLEPVTSFITDFNTAANDFTTSDFDISTPSGFSNSNLHTNHPYEESNIEAKKYNSIAQLNYPVILKENGEMTFNEVVLVEPGEIGTVFTEDLFWDFVIVEGSKDNGKTWHPFADGYDSGVSETWETQFSNNLKSSVSSAAGDESMFLENRINLTENDFFAAGDTVLVRFRLASDNSVTGWGWAIDNVSIQNLNTYNNEEELIAETEANIYPNPFINNLFVDCSKLSNASEVTIQITDLVGKTVFRETKYDSHYNPKLEINLSDVRSGIYLASITDANLNTTTQKIIKN